MLSTQRMLAVISKGTVQAGTTNATHLRVDTQHHNVFPQVPGAHHLDNAAPLGFLVQLLLQLW